MKINFYLLQAELNALKTPTQVLTAKENSIEKSIRHEAITSKEEHLPITIIKELYSQNADIPEYKKVISYKQNIAAEKWYIAHEQSVSNYHTVFDINFLFGLFVIFISFFFLKKYKKFIDNLKIKNINLDEEGFPKTKICPYCSEEILYTAKKCKYCHSNLNKFGLLKNIKFNKFALYLLIGFIVITSILTIIYYLHPICTYLFYIIMAFCDPIFIILGLLSANLFDRSITLKYKIISVFAMLFIIMASISAIQNYNANMWELPKIILMILVSLFFITLGIRKLKVKYKKGFTFFFIYFFISIFLSAIIHCFYKPILPTGTNNINIKTIKESKSNYNMWGNIVYQNNQWTLYDYQDPAYIDVKDFEDVGNAYNYSEGRHYTKEEINYIHSHDMTKLENIEEYNQIFNGGDTSTLPNYSLLGARSFSSKPEYFLSMYNKNINFSYNYSANCGLANCAELNVEILKADKVNRVLTVFNKSYPQLNNGPFNITFIDDSNPLIKIEGKNKKIFVLYIPSTQEIKEYEVN